MSATFQVVARCAALTKQYAGGSQGTTFNQASKRGHLQRFKHSTVESIEKII